MSASEKDTVETVEKLLTERRKVSGWLAALAARRAETSPAVYERVRDDYTAKLEKVQAKLVAASDAVQVAAADLAGRLTDKEEGVAKKRDERAEAELRAAVGEYNEREWERRRTKLDDDLAVVTGERDALRDELRKLRTVLDEVMSSGDATTGFAEPEQGVAAPADEVAPMTSVLARGDDVFAGDDLAAPVSESSRVTPVTPMEAVAPPPPVIPIHEQSIIAAVEPAQPLAPSFDELAFLKSVVGRTTPPVPPQSQQSNAEPGAALPRSAPEPLEAQPPPTVGYDAPEPPMPFPDPVPEPRVSQEMTPPRESFFGRPTPRTSEAIKSLRCQECGTLNFPTEWYCERCGGELAAL